MMNGPPAAPTTPLELAKLVPAPPVPVQEIVTFAADQFAEADPHDHGGALRSTLYGPPCGELMLMQLPARSHTLIGAMKALGVWLPAPTLVVKVIVDEPARPLPESATLHCTVASLPRHVVVDGGV